MKTPGEAGFTLLEILLALTITAIVMAIVYQSLKSAGTSLQTLSVRNQLYRSAHALLDEMAQELASAFLSRHPASKQGRARTYFYVENNESYGMSQASLFFTTYGHAFALTAPGQSDQSEICYWTRYSQKREELILLKKEDLTLDGQTCREESLDNWDVISEEMPTPVATGIHPDKGTGYRLVGFKVECFGTQEGPVEEWDSNRQRLLPRRVRITLTYQDGNENTYPFSRTVLLRLQEANLIPSARAGTSPGRSLPRSVPSGSSPTR